MEDAIEVGLALQMRERIAHADDQLDARWHEPGHVADVARDRLDGQTARPVPQLGEESLTEVDGQHPKAEPRQRDGLDARAAAEIDGQPARRPRADAQSFEQRALLGHFGLEVTKHARVVLRQHPVVDRGDTQISVRTGQNQRAGALFGNSDRHVTID